MKIAYIMRGVPGSGKSTVARQLAGETGVIHSTDSYFMVNGQYFFNPIKLAEYHNWNHHSFCESLKSGIPIVICDNTNIQKRDFEKYVRSADEAGYMVVFVVMSHPNPRLASERNNHGVPEHIIRKMIERFEH